MIESLQIKHRIIIRYSFAFFVNYCTNFGRGGKNLSHIRQRKPQCILGRITLYLSGLKNRTYLLVDSYPVRYFSPAALFLLAAQCANFRSV